MWSLRQIAFYGANRILRQERRRQVAAAAEHMLMKGVIINAADERQIAETAAERQVNA